MTRRGFIWRAAAPLAIPGLRLLPAGDGAVKSRLGIASTSFAGVDPVTGPGTGSPSSSASSAARIERPASNRPGRDAYQFLEKCHTFGAAGIQAQLNGDLRMLRARAEQLGMWIEGMVSVPRNGDVAGLERSLIDAKTAGANVVRVALLSGRRYESFATLDDWKKWVAQTHEALKLAVPVIEKQKIAVAIENHKDWTLEDMQRLLRDYSSEYLGVCFDFGNNIALLDDPLEMAEALASYTKSTHVKDMGVRPYADGFLLSEVPLGTGILDLKGMISVLLKANPKLNFSLEMITRDPLKVPCMTPQYWTVFPERNGRYLAQTFKLVQQRSSGEPLPVVSQLTREERVRVEEQNVRACLAYASEKNLIR
jgi:sugar phosphate isomerase/epimerase